MPRVAFRLWLRPEQDAIETYVRGHLDPFPSLYDRIRAAGLRRYTIWLDGTDLLLTREGVDPYKGETLDLSDPVQQRWVDTMTPLFAERARDGAGHPDEVMALDPDAEPGPAQMTYRTGLRPGPDAMQNATDVFRDVPAAVTDAMRAAGIRREWTWIEDGSAWTYRECDDLGATEAALAASDPVSSWWTGMAPVLDERTQREGRRRTREVFRCD